MIQVFLPPSHMLVSDEPLTRLAMRPAQFRIAARSAVARAMVRSHTDNPAGYHARRPAERGCPHDENCPFAR